MNPKRSGLVRKHDARGGEPNAPRAAIKTARRVPAEMFLREYEAQCGGWFWQTDEHGYIVYISAKVAQLIGGDDNALVAKPISDLFLADEEKAHSRNLPFHLMSKTAFNEIAVRSNTREGSRLWSISGRPLLDSLGYFQGFIGTGTDLTEKRRSEAEIARLAMSDALTGLANRQRMRHALNEALNDSRQTYRSTVVFMLDLDRFKAVNDTLGHQAGDELLEQVAQRLVRCAGDRAMIGRLGGDEFQLLITGTTNENALAELAKSIIYSLSQPYFIAKSSVTIGCSIGIARAPSDGDDPESIVRSADLALYAAKASGRGVHQFYNSAMLNEAQQRKELEEDLRNALVLDQLHLEYQPVVRTADEAISGFEALLRWTHPVRGAISPAEFIPIAEDCGLIEMLGEWALRTATTAAANWSQPVRVAVNVSPMQFASSRLSSVVANALAKSGLAPERLELEITESVFINDGAATARMFKSLKGLGVRLALDDFGTGFSSLGYLKTAPFDKIKIDQSFVRGAAEPGNRNLAIIKAVVTLANAMNMETTAEGAEVQDEIELLRQAGATHIQGYVYSKPLSNDAAGALLAANGGIAEPQGHKVSRATRTRMLRAAQLKTANAEGTVRLRNISAGGCMIEGIQFPKDPTGDLVELDFGPGNTAKASIVWTINDQIGLKFIRPFDVETLNKRR